MSKTPRTSFFERFRTRSGHGNQLPQYPASAPTNSPVYTPVDPNEKREMMIENLLSQNVIDVEKIRNMAWAGIPDRFRAEIWRLFLDYQPVNKNLSETTLTHKRNDYFDCLERVYSESQRHLWTNAQKSTISQIDRDLPRTKIILLRNKKVQDLFERVLFVWSVRHPASGYVQGMNDLLQPFFFAFLIPHHQIKDPSQLEKLENIDDISEEALKEIEADCFWCFSKLLDGLQDLYTKDQPGLYKILDNIQLVIDKVNPELAQHIAAEEIQYQEFAFRWVNCLLVREFSVSIIFRIWDNYLSHHNRIATSHVYMCAALMDAMAYKLMPLNHAEFIILMQAIDPNGWHPQEIEDMLAQAYVFEKSMASANSSSASAGNLRSLSQSNLVVEK
ncbi:TBC domain containing protein [Trichomonas vaginalis G3]|uniref:TBC domain containing protein n=1 Tax=Trichomonas vaginalis (strain ATCC PRA-98 / G3) TaxID=412133 RepID=A2ETC6_TRIV3|nr:regulation of vesicle fusion [Trichomonas vaginalis G3]EAY04116.1 TBC domain containing protein [Trichomonas vaginalis G3]KAI5503866.1 regulation of vesicle fusion [Trichomonas vaginalis G3]|eukprot:XP_001316339.1 TBC domain containing protein [Trichomonas vaginalis G3]